MIRIVIARSRHARAACRRHAGARADASATGTADAAAQGAGHGQSSATSCASAIWSRTPAPPPTSPMFRAPDLGQTGTRAGRARRSTRCGRTTSIGSTPRGLTEVVVTRASRADHRARTSRTRIARALRRPVRLRRRAATSPSPSTATSRTLHVEPSATGDLADRAHERRSAHAAASTSRSSCRAARSRGAAAALHRHR